MHTSTLLLLSGVFSLSQSQSQSIPVPNGVIVPFTSDLPPCASVCGRLFDVQGACSPPVLAAVSSSCFCADSRLTPIMNSGTAGVTSVCGTSSPESCTAASDLEKIQSWYATFCNLKDPNAQSTSTASGAGANSTGTSGSDAQSPPASQTWLQGHWKYIVMLVVMIIAIVGGWFGAIFLRRRYIRKKEREIEMKPPIAWGPHQMQGATGGYSYSGGGSKEATTMTGAIAPPNAQKEGRGWLSKIRG